MKDYYNVLGVEKDASGAEIKRAYRKLAHKYHPDKGEGGDEKKFREVSEAYEVLSDQEKRQRYDQFGTAFARGSGGQAGGFGGFSGFTDFSDFMSGFGSNYSQGPYSGIEFDFGDIFSDIFGSPRRGRRDKGIDLEVGLEIDFLDSVFGTEKTITVEKKDACPACEGSGADGGESKVMTCPKCHGQGQIISHHKTFLGSIKRASTCDRCKGSGKVPEKECKECGGTGRKEQTKEIKVVIPPGIESGQRLKLTGEGEVGYRGSATGDLYIRISVKPHPGFVRDGYNIRSEVPVSFYQAVLGTKMEVNTVDGPVELKIPSGIQSGKVLRLRNKGVKHLESGKRGDHLVTIRVVTPQKLSRKEKQLLKQLAEEQGEVVDIDEGLWDKIKDSFGE